MPREFSAGAIIFRKEPYTRTSSVQGKGNQIYYLLLHYGAGHWDFPKGHINKGENELETAIRESQEETGLNDIRPVEGFKEGVKYFFIWEGKNILKFVSFFLFETKTKEIKISSEHIGYKWLPYEEALKQLTFKNAKEILKKANEFLMKLKT